MFQKSYAKINLFLDVVGSRRDGYHDIKTVFSEIELHDELNFVLTKNEAIQILTNTDKIKLENNLIYQIAFFIKQNYDVKEGCKIELKKQIPIAAGLGGGSSNAAVTIEALNEIWNVKLDLAEKQRIAEQFGSDISFFFQGGTAIGEGRGEIITPVEDIDIENLVLVNPGFPISSKEAYSIVSDIDFNQQKWEQFTETWDTQYCNNKLEEKISETYPVIQNILQNMKDLGAYHSILSGSGATVIGFCKNFQIAQEISKFYSKKQYWNCITKTKRRTL